jgi:catechol 2,3-dioxygenase-like lactoylglutathione lyase family enzyme
MVINHINIRTRDVAATLNFFRDVLQMKVSCTPLSPDLSRSGWVLDINGDPVVHVARADSEYPAGADLAPAMAIGSGAIHHVAFQCSNYEQARSRFLQMGLEFTENHVDVIDLRQLFIRDPNGILFELNFP